MSIDTVIDLIDTQLQNDLVWGSDIDWSNMDGGFQVPEANCPKTLVYIEQAPMINSSTLSDETQWDFHFKCVYWMGGLITTKANFKKYTELHNDFKTIYNQIINNLDCGWVSSFLNSDYENIDERLIVQERFSITIAENR